MSTNDGNEIDDENMHTLKSIKFVTIDKKKITGWNVNGINQKYI